MAPLRFFTNWNTRPSDSLGVIEPYRKYYLICEGENTEKWYFEQLISDKRTLNINPAIEVKYVERTDEDTHNSNPIKLIQYGKQLVEDESIDFDERDVIIIIFDADIYNSDEQAYQKIIELAHENNFLVGVTNPCFELFLLLHLENSVCDIILPNESDILENKKISKKRTYTQKLLTDKTKINPKENQGISQLSRYIDIAINQELLINQDIYKCIGNLTSNIGDIINRIRGDK